MMAKFILGLLIGAGIAFCSFAYVEEKERKKIDNYEKWRSKLP